MWRGRSKFRWSTKRRLSRAWCWTGRIEPFAQATNAAFLEAVLGAKDYEAYQAWDHQMQEHLKTLEQRPVPPSMLALKEVSFGKWLEGQKLPPRVGALIRATLEPEIGTTLESISAVDGIAEWHVFTAPGARPHHVVGGNQRLVEALAANLGEARLRLNTQVTHVIQTPDGVEVRAIDTATSRVLPPERKSRRSGHPALSAARASVHAPPAG